MYVAAWRKVGGGQVHLQFIGPASVVLRTGVCLVLRGLARRAPVHLLCSNGRRDGALVDGALSHDVSFPCPPSIPLTSHAFCLPRCWQMSSMILEWEVVAHRRASRSTKAMYNPRRCSRRAMAAVSTLLRLVELLQLPVPVLLARGPEAEETTKRNIRPRQDALARCPVYICGGSNSRLRSSRGSK